MRYTGNICDGCNEPLLDSDDIVVCPECGTPQHRHCYDKNNQCVNAYLHDEGFSWQGTISEKTSAESSTLVNEDKNGEDIICPNCKQSNPSGTEVCRHCGMKFTLFGINVVESLKEQQRKEEGFPKSSDMPEYKPPFTVGEGEGFDNSPIQEEVKPEPVVISPEDPEFFNNDGNIFRGPYPEDDYTASVKTNTIGSFIRNNAQVYISKFKISDVKGRSSFNWAAFFFAPYWFFYRKLYKPGIIMLTVQLCASIVASPYLEKFLKVYEKLATVDIETITDEAFNMIFLEMQSAMTPVWVLIGFIFVLHIISGFIANGLYKKYVIKNINYALSLPAVRGKIAHFAKYGGASMIAVMVAYFAETALSYLASYLMY
jgi:ribosomal protein L40E